MKITLEEYFNNLTEAKNLGLSRKVSDNASRIDAIDNLGMTNEALAKLVVSSFDEVSAKNGLSVSSLDIPKIKDPDTVVGTWHLFFKELDDNSGIAMMVKSSVVADFVCLLASLIEIKDTKDTSKWDNINTEYLTPNGVLPIWNGKFNYVVDDEEKLYSAIGSIPSIAYVENRLSGHFLWAQEPGSWWDRAWLRNDFTEAKSDLKMLAKALDEKIRLAEHDVIYRKNLFGNFVITK